MPFKMKFYDAFLAKVEKLRKKGKKIIITGDVNTAHTEIDLARPKENEKNTGFLPKRESGSLNLLIAGMWTPFVILLKKAGITPGGIIIPAPVAVMSAGAFDYFFVTENLLPKLKNAFIVKRRHGFGPLPCGIEIIFSPKSIITYIYVLFSHPMPSIKIPVLRFAINVTPLSIVMSNLIRFGISLDKSLTFGKIRRSFSP